MASATYKLAKAARDRAKTEQAAAKARYGAGSAQHLAAIADVKSAGAVMKAESAAEGLSHDEAREKREALVLTTAGKSGQELFDIQTKIRAYGNVMREHTGRQKGQGTAYIGPGVRVRIDDAGKVVTQDGRVQYDIDPNAYAKRFIPQFTPTQEQTDYFKDIFGEDYNVSPGMVTPWQQVNLQHMLQYPGLLGKDDISDLTIEERANLGLFGEGIKEGRVPAAWREAWRTEQWGDVKDPTTGLWTPATGAKRQQAIADQLERYKMGAFNPTTGKLYLDDEGNVVGPKAVWGPGTGILHPDDVYIDNPPVTVGGGVGVGGAYAQTPYTQPAPQDWSSIAPGVFGNPLSELAVASGLPAQRAIFGDKGVYMQPWATGQQVPAGLLNYQIPGGTPANVTYSNPNLGLFDFGGAGAGAGAGIGNQAWVGPGGVTDFNAWQDAEYERMYPGRRAAAQAAGFAGLNYWKPGAAEWRASLPGGATSQDWINMYGTQAQQAAGQTAAEQIDAGWIGDEGGEYAHLFD